MNNKKLIELVGHKYETVNELIESYINKNIKEQNLKEKFYLYINDVGDIKSGNTIIKNNEYELVYSCNGLQKFEYIEGYQFQCFRIEDYCDYKKMMTWAELELEYYESEWDVLKEYDPNVYNKLVEEEMQSLINKAIKTKCENWYDRFVEKLLCSVIL